MKSRQLTKNKVFLYLTEFFSGMAVMAVELGASRLLAPYFSSSQIVWTIIIGTIMIALALGNLWGGRMADKDPDPARLYRRILLAAVWIAAIPLAGKYVIAGISALLAMTISSLLLVWAALLSCLAVFVFPMFLLGTVTPSLSKYTMDDLKSNGQVVGRLGAFNTAGSIIGTFVPTFLTIPAAGTAATFLIFSGVLAALSAVFLLSRGGHTKKLCLGLVLLVLFSVFGAKSSFAFWEKDLAYEGESVYNYLQVRDSDTQTILSTHVLLGVQSIYKKDQTFTGMYYDDALLAPVMAGAADGEGDLLVLGMGTGTYGTLCRRIFPKLRVTGVEIDEKITALAGEYFHLSPEIPVYTCDGRAFLRADQNRYDVIMVDAYQDITIPFQMSTVEFFFMVRDHLKPGGVMVLNMNMLSRKAGSINDHLTDTAAAAFSDIRILDVQGNTNRLLFASNEDYTERLSEGLSMLSGEAAAYLAEARERLVPCSAGNHLLTDDKAPVELLGMQVLDELIKKELSS